jgi:hypothetical protein
VSVGSAPCPTDSPPAALLPPPAWSFRLSNRLRLARRAGLCGPAMGRAHRRGAAQPAVGRGCVGAAALAGQGLPGYQCCAAGLSQGQLRASGFNGGPSPGYPRVASHGRNAGSRRQQLRNVL